MNIKKATYLPVFFLLCFLASFGTRTYQNFTTDYSNSEISTSKQSFNVTKQNGNYCKVEFLFEENENENEFDSFKKNLSQEDYFTFLYLVSNFISQQSAVEKNLLEKVVSSYTLSHLYIIFNVFRI